MQCPKCGLVQEDAPECKGCRIIIVRYKARSPVSSPPQPPERVPFLGTLLVLPIMAFEAVKGINWMPFIGWFGVGWAIARMSECHQEIGEGGLSMLLSLAAVVALGITLVHHWSLVEEAKKDKHWHSPSWDGGTAWEFYRWAEFMPKERLRGMAETIEAMLADREKRGIPL